MKCSFVGSFSRPADGDDMIFGYDILDFNSPVREGHMYGLQKLPHGGNTYKAGDIIDVSGWPVNAIRANENCKRIEPFAEGEAELKPKVETKTETMHTLSEEILVEKPPVPKKTKEKFCTSCGKRVSDRNKSGYCRECNVAHAREIRAEKRKANATDD